MDQIEICVASVKRTIGVIRLMNPLVGSRKITMSVFGPDPDLSAALSSLK